MMRVASREAARQPKPIGIDNALPLLLMMMKKKRFPLIYNSEHNQSSTVTQIPCYLLITRVTTLLESSVV